MWFGDGFAGRVGALVVECAGESFFLVGVHGSHGEGHSESVDNIASLMVHKPDNATVFAVGDWNVDQFEVVVSGGFC